MKGNIRMKMFLVHYVLKIIVQEASAADDDDRKSTEGYAKSHLKIYQDG